VVTRWREYLEELYQGDELLDINEEIDEYSYGAPLLRSEFNASLRDLKNKKAPGIDKIPGELLQNASESIIDALYYLMKDIYETGVIPKDFCNSRIVTLPKKNKADSCT